MRDTIRLPDSAVADPILGWLLRVMVGLGVLSSLVGCSTVLMGSALLLNSARNAHTPAYTSCAAYQANSALSEAAKAGDLARARLLLRQRQVISDADVLDAKRALIIASVCGHGEIADEILKTELDLQNSRYGGMPFFRVLADTAEPEIFARVLALGNFDLDETDKTYGTTALHSLACEPAKRTENIPILLRYGASKEIRSRSGDTPLMTAIHCGNRKAQALLQ